MESKGKSNQNAGRNGKLLAAWLPVEVPILLGLAFFFFLLGKVEWNVVWKDFQYDLRLRHLVPAIFLMAIPYVWAGRLPSLKIGKKLAFRPQMLLEIAFAAMAIVYIRTYDPITYVDDAGFILRYLDNFQKGCFFCFNVQEGPVFGLSSFMYGLLGGMMVWTGLFRLNLRSVI